MESELKVEPNQNRLSTSEADSFNVNIRIQTKTISNINSRTFQDYYIQCTCSNMNLYH